MSIADNIREIKAEVQDALRASGRTDDVTLVAVTKYSGAEAVLEAALAGQTEFAENRVQMLMEKLHALDEMRASGIEVPEINWHLIGHLQTNKVKYIIGKVKLIHSVDSLKLAQEISSRSRIRLLRSRPLVPSAQATASTPASSTACPNLHQSLISAWPKPSGTA